jgi:hypothetical protein
MTNILYNYFEECFFSKRSNQMMRIIGKLNNHSTTKNLPKKIDKISYKVNDILTLCK